MADPDDPTPRKGYPAQPDPHDALPVSPRGRARTPARGVPVLELEGVSSSGRRRSLPVIADSDEEDVGPARVTGRMVDPIIDAYVTRRLKRWRWLLAGVASVALGGLGTAAKGIVDDARSGERAKVQLEVLRGEVAELKTELAAIRPFVYRDPAPAPTWPARRHDPAPASTKGPDQ